MSDRELMQQALEALEWCRGEDLAWVNEPEFFTEAITALRERLAQPEQELKPWQTEETYDNDGVLIARRMKRGPNCEWEPWLTPPRREWVGLTDDELEMLELKHAPPVHPEFVKDDDWWEFARAIEAKLKEKNSAQ